jgi:hypothetical protein
MTRCVVRLLGREATADMALRLLVDVELSSSARSCSA